MNEKDNVKGLMKYIDYYKDRHNKYPTIANIKAEFPLKTENEIMQGLYALEKQGKIALKNKKNEKMKPVKSKYNDIEIVPIKTRFNFSELIKLTSIKIILAIVGILTTVMSIYYTYLWFCISMKWYWSIMWSMGLVSCNIGSFEARIVYRQRGQTKEKWLFLCVWIVTILFSMSTSVAGQLNLGIEKDMILQINSNQDNNNVLLFEQYDNQIGDYKAEIESLKLDIRSKREERTKLLDFLDNMIFYDEKQYKDFNYRIYLKDRDIKEFNAKISIINSTIMELQNKKEEMLKDNVKVNVKKNVDFFDWLGNVMNADAEFIRLLQFLFLAVFIDVVSPIAFMVVLFLEYKKE